MPYIKQSERETIDPLVPHPSQMWVMGVGSLNYLLTRIVLLWIGSGGYSRMNAALGVLEAVKQELYRRQIAPYEDEKCEANGDVY